MMNALEEHVRSQSEATFAEGVAFMLAGSGQQAEACFLRATHLNPELAEAHTNLGILLEKRGDLDSAEMRYRRAIQLGACHPELFLNLGALLCTRQRFTEAHAAYQQALKLAPEQAAIWSNLGALYACEKQFDHAEHCYHQALLLEPEHSGANFNLGCLRLRQGLFAEGWRRLEYRDWYAAWEQALDFPRWQGEPIQDAHLLIVCEAGQGDMIQFCRYLSLLKAQGAARVDVVCQPPLKRLLATLAGVDTVLALGEPMPAAHWDYWVPPLSLPYRFDTLLHTIPAPIPYLQPRPADIAHWEPQLPRMGLRVGLVWKGNPRFENDSARSLPHLSLLAPLWSLPGISFVSLQKGGGEDEVWADQAAYPITVLGPTLSDFADTAAVIAGLDLVISVDTAVAHLAGALGTPCWVLLPDYSTDWRWLQGRSDTPWYPQGMRLFHQPRAGDWDTPIQAIAAALATHPGGA